MAVVEAGGGYGKSTLAAELARALGIGTAYVRLEPGDEDPTLFIARLRRSLRRSGLSDAAGAIERSGGPPDAALEALLDRLAELRDPMLLIVDEVELAGQGSDRLVVRLAHDLPVPHRLVLVGRVLPGAVASLKSDPRVTVLETAELAFSVEEGEKLFAALSQVELDRNTVTKLVSVSRGWAAALVLAAERLARSPHPAAEAEALAVRTELLSYLVGRQLDGLEPDEVRGLGQLAHLPLLTPEIAAAVTGIPSLLDTAARAGLPFDRGGDGVVALPGPVRELLADRSPLEPTIARAAAGAYLERGEIGHALNVLVAAGLEPEAAATLAGLPPADVESLDFGELRALVGMLGSASITASPRILLHVARACEPAAEAKVRADALRRAACSTREDAVLSREVDAEIGRDLIRDGSIDDAAALAERLLREAGADELQTRVRALHVLGRTYAWRGDPASLAAAEPLLLEAAELYLHLGHESWSAHARLALAYDVYTRSGRLDEAVACLEDALASLSGRTRLRAVLLAFHAESLIDLGSYADAEASLAEADRLGRALGDSRVCAYVPWLTARACAQRGDLEPVAQLLADAERSRGDWFDHHTGVEFLAEAATLCERARDHELALVYLERARARAGETPRHVSLAEGTILALSGEPQEGEAALAPLAFVPELELRTRWRVALLRGWAALRRGDELAAGSFAAEAFDIAASVQHPELPLVGERELATSLLPLAARAGSEAAAAATPAELPARILVLGRFEAARGARRLDLPPGRPTQLVKLLAASGGRMGVERAIEALWPNVEPTSGRKRLRNVLNRLREAAGDVVVRDADALALAQGTEVDAIAFERDAAAALSAGGPEMAGRARAALARYGGALLPDDGYEDWAAEPRERLRARQLALLDLLAAEAGERGELDEALRLLERATEEDRLDEARQLRVARLLLAQGRRGRALDVLRRAAATSRQLGLEPSDEHRALVRSVRG